MYNLSKQIHNVLPSVHSARQEENLESRLSCHGTLDNTLPYGSSVSLHFNSLISSGFLSPVNIGINFDATAPLATCWGAIRKSCWPFLSFHRLLPFLAGRGPLIHQLVREVLGTLCWLLQTVYYCVVEGRGSKGLLPGASSWRNRLTQREWEEA